MVVIIDSGGANITSVIAAFDRLGVESVFTDDAQIIQSAERVILPGVGAAADAMKNLEQRGLVDVISGLKQPVLGICLGMQLLFSRSDEGGVDTLGIVDGDVEHFTPEEGRTIPHMGWNNVIGCRDGHPLLSGLSDESYFYFVHSYFAPVVEQTIARCDYGDVFTAIVAQENFMGCQFHPERSGPAGQRVLKNFIEMKA